MTTIPQKDKQILRDLAKKQIEMANTPAMDTLRAEWTRHGSFASDTRPMIRIEVGSFSDDIIPQMLRCESEAGRKLEWELIESTINHEHFKDDTLVMDYLPVTCHKYFVPFGIEIVYEHPEEASLGHQFAPSIEDLEQDFHKLGNAIYGVEPETSQKIIDYKNEIIGDILPVRMSPFSMVCSPTQDIVHIMRMEDMFTAMYDYPELFHQTMGMLTDDYLKYFDLLEHEKIFLPTVEDINLCQGSYSYTDELPAQGVGLKTKDIWTYMDSQETSGVSPEMFGEFIAPYYRKIAERFGLLSYGCCEAVDPIWDVFLSKLTNLRKVSIAPWANEEYMGERLRNKRTVYARKPFPNYLGVGDVLDENAIESHISKTVEAAKGCYLEIIQRDVYRVSQSTQKVKRFVEIIRKCCEKHI